jgi:hypothetical protein
MSGKRERKKELVTSIRNVSVNEQADLPENPSIFEGLKTG